MDQEIALRGLCSGRGSSPSVRAKFAQPVGLCGAVSALVVDLYGPSTPTRCRRCAGDSKLPVSPTPWRHTQLSRPEGPLFRPRAAGRSPARPSLEERIWSRSERGLGLSAAGSWHSLVAPAGRTGCAGLGVGGGKTDSLGPWMLQCPVPGVVLSGHGSLLPGGSWTCAETCPGKPRAGARE